MCVLDRYGAGEPEGSYAGEGQQVQLELLVFLVRDHDNHPDPVTASSQDSG